MTTQDRIERCGICGRYFQGQEYVDAVIDDGNVTLGYCPNAQQEEYEQNESIYHRQVTRDMAIDACDPSLEGQWM